MNTIKRILAKLKQRPKEESRKETCDYCKHLYCNSDGSVSCDSPFESVCLKSDTRMFKELSNLA